MARSALTARLLRTVALRAESARGAQNQTFRRTQVRRLNAFMQLPGEPIEYELLMVVA